jgi:histidyl-tRNA synthetase
VTNVFIFEETGKKNREKWQCGAEFLGNFKPTADIELILLAIEVIRSLRIGNVELKLSHAGLLKALIQELNLAPEEKHALLDQIQDGNWQTLTQTKTSNADINKMLSLLLDLKGKSSGFLENLKALPQISAESKSQLEKFMEITSLLDMLGCRYQIDITSTKGFEYYTGLCFQLSVNQERVGSGGRYDNLIPLIGGSNTPACGFALYLDPLIDMIPPKAQENTEKKVLIRIKSITPNVVKTGFQIAQSFREVGYIAELDFNNRKPNYRWVITVEDKLSTFTITDQTKNLNKELSSISDAIKMLGGSV